MVGYSRAAEWLPDVSTVTNEVVIRFRKSALDSIVAEAAASLDGKETGGILLGHTWDGHIVVTGAGGPGARARRTAVTFDRDLLHAQELANAAWMQDRSQWIGEWHTHPGGALAPSPRDVASYLTHLRDAELCFDQFVCVIAGLLSTDGLPLSAWIVRLGGVRQAPIEVVREIE